MLQGDDLVGDMTKDGAMFVKARLQDGNFLLCNVDGFKTSYAVKSEADTIEVASQNTPVANHTNAGMRDLSPLAATRVCGFVLCHNSHSWRPLTS